MLLEKLDGLGACSEALKWVKEMNEDNPEKLWNECERGDWMLWLITQLDIDRKRLVLAACRCARLSLHLVHDNRPKIAIETAEAWVRGEAEATLEELDLAAVGAAESAAGAAESAAWAAAESAAWAARAAAEAAEAAVLKECANIIRQIFTYDEVVEILFKGN